MDEMVEKIERAIGLFIAVIAFAVAFSKGVKATANEDIANQGLAVGIGVSLGAEAMVILGTMRLRRSLKSLWAWIGISVGLAFSIFASVSSVDTDTKNKPLAIAVSALPLVLYFIAVKILITQPPTKTFSPQLTQPLNPPLNPGLDQGQLTPLTHTLNPSADPQVIPAQRDKDKPNWKEKITLHLNQHGYLSGNQIVKLDEFKECSLSTAKLYASEWKKTHPEEFANA